MLFTFQELESAESNVQYLKTALSSLPPLCARDTAQRSDTSQDNSVCSETPPSTAAAETEDNHDERYNHSETEHAEAETKMPGVGEASVIQASLAGRGERDPVGCDVGSGMTGLLQAEKDRKEASTKSVHSCSTNSLNFDIHEVQVSDMTVQGQLECSSVSAPEKVSDMTVQGQLECSSVSAPEKVSDMTVQGQLECSSVSAPEKVSDMTVQGQLECSSVSAPEKVSDMTVQGQLECSSVSAPEKVSDMTVQGQLECSSVSAPEKVSDMTVQGQLECSSVSAPEKVSDMTVQGQLECSSVSAPEKVSDMTVQGQLECSSVSAPEKVSDMTVQGQLECSSVSAPEKVSDMTVQGQLECSSVSAPEKSDKSSAGVSSRLQQLARALVSSVLCSVQSPFSLTEFSKSHSPAPGKPLDSQSHLPCKASLKRKHQEHTEASSGDIHHELPPACHENDCTEKCQSSVSSPVNTKQHCRRGEEETVLGAEMCSDKDEARNSSEPVHRDKGREKSHLISTQRLPDSPRLQTTVYVPQPCAIEQYMKSIGEDIEKERDMCLPDEEESMSEERAEDKGERTGSSVEERLLQCVLHPDVVTLIAEKLLQYQTEIIT